ncbi:MAG: hypothetical protein K2H45_14160, partial [Acetatifactor sp.]|nr:hypothetical protein [Acetatifactor sp.]
KNDLAFTVKNRVLVISEHQSTINENMPLRDLIYLGRTLEKVLDEKSLYRRKMIHIPTPEFYVFYNGDAPFPSEKILRLSDAYLEKTEHPMLELEVKVININPSSGHRILKECRPMYEYSWFIQQIKNYLADGWSRDDAITQAVQDCLDNGIMVEFMREHGSEAVNMLYTQWNWDDAMEVEREEAYEDGVEAGRIEGIAEGKSLGDIIRSRQAILDLLEDLGDIPGDIQSRIDAEEDTQVLRRWHKAAAKSVNFDAFREKME